MEQEANGSESLEQQAENSVSEDSVSTEGVRETPHAPSRPVRRRRLGRVFGTVLGCVLVVLAVPSGMLYYRWHSTASMYALVPDQTIALASGDAGWVWETFKDCEDSDTAAKQPDSEAEKAFEQDILPWVGHVGLVLIDATPGSARGAVFAEIKSPAGYLRAYRSMRSSMKKSKHIKWTERRYHGIRVMTGDLDMGMFPLKVSVGLVGRWIVAGLGDGSIEQIIDTYQGRTPSLEDNSDWQQALGKIPDKPVTTIAISFQQVDLATRYLGQLDPAATAMPDLSRQGFMDYITVGSMAADGDCLRFDSVLIPASDETRILWKEFRSGVVPVDGESMAHLPDDTAGILILTNPAAWMEQIERVALSIAVTADSRQKMEQDFAALKPVRQILGHVTGECAISITARPKEGFGFCIIGETAGADSARQAAAQLTDIATSHGVPLVQRGSLVVAAVGDNSDPKDKNAPCWSTNGKWVYAASHPDWLKRTPSSKVIELPAEARHADMAGLLNGRILIPMVEEQINKSKDHEALKELEDLGDPGLGEFGMVWWTRFDPEGRWQQTTCRMQEIEWQKMLEATGRAVEQHRDSLMPPMFPPM